MGGHCCGLNSKEESSSQNYPSSAQESKVTAESESAVALTKKKKKKEEEKKKDENKKEDRVRKASKGGGSINKLNGGSKHSKQMPSSLNQAPQRQKSKAKQTVDGGGGGGGGGGSRSKPTSSMAYGNGGNSSYALALSSVGQARTARTATSAGSSTTGNHQPQQLYTSTNKPYRLNSGRLNPLDGVRDEQLLTVGLAGRPLGRDQALKRAKVGGATVNGDFVYQLTTRRTLEKLRRAAGAGADVMTILQEEFAALSPIVPGVYLTGTFGLQKEAFETAKIWVVVNATTELPLLKLPQLLAVRVPVEDDTAHRIDRYFDDVADLMETARRRGYGSVVHCAAGVSRSAALTLAYLLKYTDLSLLEAFRHTRTVRPVIRPNTGFMEQLVEFERKLRGDGRTSVRMLHVTDEKRRVTVYVPDFYQQEYPELYEREVVKQQELMMATAAAAASATITPAPVATAATSAAAASSSSAISSTSNIGH